MVIEDAAKILMAKHKVSQAELSRRTGIPASTLNRYLKQGADMPVSNAKLIATALGVTVDELLGLPYRISADEKELVECYRAMSPRFQALLVENARAYADSGRAKNNGVSNAG